MNDRETGLYSHAFHLMDRYNSFKNFNNHKLGIVIRENERAIEQSGELISKKFGLKIDKPKIITGLEQELIGPHDISTIKNAEVRGGRDPYFDDEQNFEGNLKAHNFIFDGTQTVKIKDGEELLKNEIKTFRPSSIAAQLFNYTRTLFLIEDTFGMSLNRYSSQVNYSLHSTGEKDKKPLFANSDLREFIGNNVVKFMDEGLVLLDTRKSIQNTKGDAYIEKGGISTDRVSYFDQESDNMRCRFLLAYRSSDKINPEVAVTDEPATDLSPQRHEFRRMMPGGGPQTYHFCDSTVVAYAIITSAIRHGLETGIQEMVKPYNYRGTEYNEHMHKLKHSKLLRQYLGEENVDMLTREVLKYNVYKELEEKGTVDLTAHDFHNR